MRTASAVLGLLIASTDAFCPLAGLHTSRPPVHTSSSPFIGQQQQRPRRNLQEPCAIASVPEARDDAAATKVLDTGCIGRYLFAVLIQITLISTAFGFIDLFAYGPLPGQIQLGGPLPWQAVTAIFVALSAGSRVFNVLDNSRPEARGLASAEDDAALLERLENPKKMRVSELRSACESRSMQEDATMTKEELAERLRAYFAAKGTADQGGAAEVLTPGWKPPGVVFPLVWLGAVAPLRAFSASLVYEASTGRLNEAHLNDPVLLWLVLHLCIGDVFNTANVVEGRLGAAVPAAACAWLTSLFAAKQFYDVAPLAGGLLGLTAVWIGVAAALVADTWRINNAVAAEPLYPWKNEGTRSLTRYFFE